MAYFSAEKRTRNISGTDFARSDLSPGLLCEFVLKGEFTFEIPVLEISPKTGGGHSYIIEDMNVRQGLTNPYPLQTKISAKFWTLVDMQTNGGKFSEIYTLKRRKMNFSLYIFA